MQNAATFAIKNSDNEYIAIHDGRPQQFRFFERDDRILEAKSGASYQGVVTQTVQINEKSLRTVRFELSRLPYGRPVVGITLFSIMGGNLFSPTWFVYRRDVRKSIGFFDQRHDVLGDWDLMFGCYASST
jgi:hypothetical protein